MGHDVDPDAVLFLVRILNLGLLLHRGSGLPGPDADAWQALVARLVSSFGVGPDPTSDEAGPSAPTNDPTTNEPDDTTTGHPEDQR